MSLLALATDAIKYARACTPLKSDNKNYGQLAPMPDAKKQAYSPANRQARQLAVWNLKLKTPQRPCSLSEVLDYGHRVSASKAGNCFEQCAAALIYITWIIQKDIEDRTTTFNIVSLAAPGDHAFVVLNQPLTGPMYPKEFADWKADAVICDPWAKIACYAPEYPTAWKNKMDKWATRGLELGMSKPDSPKWYDAIESNDKLPYIAA